MEDILMECEEALVEEVQGLLDVRRNSGGWSAEDICNLEKVLKSIEHIERSVMMDSVDPEENYRGGRSYGYNDGYSNRNYSQNSSGSRYNVRMSSRSYPNRRSGHVDPMLKSEIEKRLSMAKDENERMVYINWLNEMNS